MSPSAQAAATRRCTKTRFPCHGPAKHRDYVFAPYATYLLNSSARRFLADAAMMAAVAAAKEAKAMSNSPSRRMKIGDFLLRRLKEAGVRHLFGVPGQKWV